MSTILFIMAAICFLLAALGSTVLPAPVAVGLMFLATGHATNGQVPIRGLR